MLPEIKYNPEVQILWNYLRATFAITAVVPLYYEGVIAGSEFLTYAATKLYMFLQLTGMSDAVVANIPRFRLYNAANALFQNIGFTSTYWDATAAGNRNIAISFDNKNGYFSRFTAEGYTNMTFIGYRITRT